MILPPPSSKVHALMLVIMTSLVVTTVLAKDNQGEGIPMPDIPLGQGETCIEDTDFMRRNHMDMLTHKRDETTLKGIRDKRTSLKECINCHVVLGPDSKAVTIASPQHFCRSCHDYAAVKVDCFQCHASRPDSDYGNTGHDETFARVNNR